MALTRPKIAQVNTVVTSISDPITVLNQGATQANIDIGFIMNRTGGNIANVALYWDESDKEFAAVYTTTPGHLDANIIITDYANLKVSTISATTANISGNISTSSYFIGDGSLLTGIGAPDNINSGDSNVTVTGDYVNVAIHSTNIGSFSASGFTISGNLAITGAPLAAIYGGTGISSYAKGDILYASNTNVLSVLTAGNSYELLQIDANGVPYWDTIDGGTY